MNRRDFLKVFGFASVSVAIPNLFTIQPEPQKSEEEQNNDDFVTLRIHKNSLISFNVSRPSIIETSSFGDSGWKHYIVDEGRPITATLELQADRDVIKQIVDVFRYKNSGGMS